jgi:hypothetical protein
VRAVLALCRSGVDVHLPAGVFDVDQGELSQLRKVASRLLRRKVRVAARWLP